MMSTMRTTKLWMASSYGVETGEAVSEGGVSGGGRGGLPILILKSVFWGGLFYFLVDRKTHY